MLTILTESLVRMLKGNKLNKTKLKNNQSVSVCNISNINFKVLVIYHMTVSQILLVMSVSNMSLNF